MVVHVIARLKCPQCGCETFKKAFVAVPEFYPLGNDKIYFDIDVCTNCGWFSHPLNARGLKRILKFMLTPHGYPQSWYTDLAEYANQFTFAFEKIEKEISEINFPEFILRGEVSGKSSNSSEETARNDD